MNYEKVLGEHKFPTYEELKTGLIRLIDEGKISQEDAARLLPELRESEEEMIRKEIISIVKQYGRICEKEGDHCYTIGDCLSYLEKQKEQKPEIKYVYPKFRKGDVIEPITPNGHFTPVRVVGIWDGSYSCRSDDDKAYLSLPIKHEDEYRLVEQKPAEWSEEDKKLIDDVINSLCCYQNTLSDYQKEIVGEEIRKLKSLKPQPKQE